MIISSQTMQIGGPREAAPRLQFRLLPDDHFGPDRDALIEVGDVGVIVIAR